MGENLLTLDQAKEQIADLKSDSFFYSGSLNLNSC